ncbi:MAG: signal peptidase I [Clostridia bacterium]|nr:signal peptidase I [Clostridia bacterium]
MYAEIDDIVKYTNVLEAVCMQQPNPDIKPENGPHERRTQKAGHTLFLVTGLLLCFLLLAAIAAAFFVGGGEGTPRKIMGYSFFTLMSDSMDSQIPMGSIVVIRHTDQQKIIIGDVVTYIRENNTTVTHKVVDIFEDYSHSGMRGFETQGVDIPLPDPDIVYANNIIGRVVWHSAFIGRMLIFLLVNWIYVVIVVVLLVGANVAVRKFF